jgi:hypothetical protein
MEEAGHFSRLMPFYRTVRRLGFWRYVAVASALALILSYYKNIPNMGYCFSYAACKEFLVTELARLFSLETTFFE